MQVLVHQFNKKDYSQSDEAAEESKSDGFASEQEEEEIDQAVPLMNSIKTMLNKLKERYESSYGKEWVLSSEIKWLISYLRKQLVIEVYRRRIGDGDADEADISKVLLKLIFDPIIKDVQKMKSKTDFAKVIGYDKLGILHDAANYSSYVTTFCKLFQSCMFREPSMISGWAYLINLIL